MANEQGQTQDGPDSSKCLRLNILDFTWFYITYIKNDCKKKLCFFILNLLGCSFTHYLQPCGSSHNVTEQWWLHLFPLNWHWFAFRHQTNTQWPPHLFPAVAVVPLQMPLDDGVRRAGLALQEGAAPLHAILHHLQGVFIGCRDEQADRQIRKNPFTTTTNSHHPQLSAAKNLGFGKSSSRIPIASEMPEDRDYGHRNKWR